MLRLTRLFRLAFPSIGEAMPRSLASIVIFSSEPHRGVRNQEVVNFPEKYVGQYCPLEIVEENEGEKENV